MATRRKVLSQLEVYPRQRRVMDDMEDGLIPSLSRTFRRLEGQKLEMVRRLEAMERERLRWRGGPSEWSPVEILDHIVKTETEILDAVIAVAPNGPEIPVSDRAKGFMLEWLFRSPARVKVPAKASAVLPESNCEFADLERRWDSTRSRMRAVLEGYIRLICVEAALGIL